MQNRYHKKGFTLVELVIVIAVIAVLAGVMIVTFSNVLSKANASADLQEVKAMLDAQYYDYIAEYGTPVSLKTNESGEFISFSADPIADGAQSLRSKTALITGKNGTEFTVTLIVDLQTVQELNDSLGIELTESAIGSYHLAQN